MKEKEPDKKLKYLIHDDRHDVYPEEKELNEEDEKYLKQIEEKYKR